MSDDVRFLGQFFSPDGRYSIIIEDNDRVGYAYLLDHEDRICGDVWLYNRSQAPAEPEWTDPSNAPFANSAKYVSPQIPFALPESATACSVQWQEQDAVRTAIILIDGIVAGMLAPEQRPGWAAAARENGPLAKSFANEKLPLLHSEESQHDG